MTTMTQQHPQAKSCIMRHWSNTSPSTCRKHTFRNRGFLIRFTASTHQSQNMTFCSKTPHSDYIPQKTSVVSDLTQTMSDGYRIWLMTAARTGQDRTPGSKDKSAEREYMAVKDSLFYSSCQHGGRSGLFGWYLIWAGKECFLSLLFHCAREYM